MIITKKKKYCTKRIGNNSFLQKLLRVSPKVPPK